MGIYLFAHSAIDQRLEAADTVMIDTCAIIPPVASIDERTGKRLAAQSFIGNGSRMRSKYEPDTLAEHGLSLAQAWYEFITRKVEEGAIITFPELNAEYGRQADRIKGIRPDNAVVREVARMAFEIAIALRRAPVFTDPKVPRKLRYVQGSLAARLSVVPWGGTPFQRRPDDTDLSILVHAYQAAKLSPGSTVTLVTRDYPLLGASSHWNELFMDHKGENANIGFYATDIALHSDETVPYDRRAA